MMRMSNNHFSRFLSAIKKCPFILILKSIECPVIFFYMRTYSTMKITLKSQLTINLLLKVAVTLLLTVDRFNNKKNKQSGQNNLDTAKLIFITQLVLKVGK